MDTQLPDTLSGFSSRDELARHLAEVAIAAGEIAMQYFAHGCKVDAKHDGSPVTAADIDTQRFIAQQLQVTCAAVPICGEEEGQSDVTSAAKVFFAVDPVDGTKEFIKGTGEWTVNIGLIADGRPIAGAVAIPAERQIFWGGTTACRSTYHQGKIAPGTFIHVRSVKPHAMTALCSRDHYGREAEALLTRLGVTDKHAAGSSLKMLRIAAAEADIYPRFGATMAWDTAAAHAILLAAGGDLFTVDGQRLTYDSARLRNPSFIAIGAKTLPADVFAALRDLG